MLTPFLPLELQFAHQFSLPVLASHVDDVADDCVGRCSSFCEKIKDAIFASDMESRNLVCIPTVNSREYQSKNRYFSLQSAVHSTVGKYTLSVS